MSNNTYGTVKPALFNPSNDADIFYHYKPSRSSVDTEFNGFKKVVDASNWLKNSNIDSNTDVPFNSDRRLPGMYTLSLPANIFANKGIYTIYIVPKEITCTIKDVGALASYPDVRGIVIDMKDIPENSSLFRDDNLIGYRVEYGDLVGSGLQRQDYFRIVTSNNLCDPVSQNLTTSNTGSNGYRYNPNGSLSFITLTPSTAPSFKSNTKPFIGMPNQKIVIKNTKFDPVCVEIEVTEHDIETVSYMLEGEQIRNFGNGRVTTYNFDGEIYKQMEYGRVKDNYTDREIGEFKIDKTNNIDRSLNISDFKN